MQKKRLIYLILTLFIMALGLLSRSSLLSQKSFLGTYSGDTLWAMMVYSGFRFLHPHLAPYKSAFGALLFSFAIEFSQLFKWQWLEALRHTKIGALILGFDFIYTDLICYTTGILFLFFIDNTFRDR